MTDENRELIVLEEVKYPATEDAILAFVEENKELEKLDPKIGTKSEKYLISKKTHIKAITIRTGIDKQRKHLNVAPREYINEVNSIARELTALVADTEHRLYEQRKGVEDYELTQKQLKLDEENKRVNDIAVAIQGINGIPTKAIGKSAAELKEIYSGVEIPDEDIFQERIDEALLRYSETMRTLEVMMDQASKSEQADELIKAEKERAAKVKAEEDKKREEELKSLEAEKKKLADERAVFNRQQHDIEEKRRKEVAEKEAEELAKKQAEEQERIKREQEAEAERVDAEKKEKAAISERAVKTAESNATTELTDIIIATKNQPANEVAGHILSQIIQGNIPGVEWIYNG